MFYFCIRQGCAAFRAPVYKPVSSVDESLVIKLNEEVSYCLVAAFVHCKSLSVPVAGVSQLAALLCNLAAVFFLPLPGSLEEFLSAKVFLLLALFLSDFFYNLNLCCYAGVIASRKPQGAVSLESLESCENILKCLVQCMSHVKLPRDIRWRHYYCKRSFVGIYLGLECAAFFPLPVYSVFKFFRVVGFC